MIKVHELIDSQFDEEHIAEIVRKITNMSQILLMYSVSVRYDISVKNLQNEIELVINY